MKMYYYSMCMLLCCLVFAASAHAQSLNSHSREKSVNDIENRTVYAAVNHTEWEEHGMTTFKTDNPEDMTLVHEWGKSTGILAGAAANGEYYGFFYEYNSGVVPIAISKVNLRTGSITDIIDMSEFMIKFQDMTFDYSTNTMYAVGFEYGTSRLYIINIEKKVVTAGPDLKTNTGKMTIATLAATYDGRMYGLNAQGSLYQIDKETGNLTHIMDTQLALQSMQSMEFDHTDESLYWAADVQTKWEPGPGEPMNSLYKIDIEKKTCKSMGQLGASGSRAVGLYIPFVKAGFGAPGAATDLSVVPESQGKEEAMISWKNPEKTYGGDALTGNISVILERDNEVISSSVSEPGAEISWTDTDVKQGMHQYTVKVSNSVGEGLRADYDAYIGNDVPGRTADLAVNVGNECKSIKLTWTTPTKGAHNGYYDPANVKYKIVRYPDNVVLEDDYGKTSYEDNSMKRLAAYYYGITASNEAGSNQEYISQKPVIAGKALEIPYTTGFEDNTLAMNQWTIVNANNDGCILQFNSGFDELIYGQEHRTNGIDYVTDPQTSQKDADDWFISPPLVLESDKDYYLSFDTRSAGVDELNITFGELNTPQSQKQLIKSGLFTEPADPDEYKFRNHQYQLPKGKGIYCIGFNLVTVFGESMMFQLNNLRIAEGVADNLETIPASEAAKISLDGDLLTVEGDFRTAEVYDMAGMRIVSLNRDHTQVSTVGWQPGIYLVKISGTETVATQKVMIQ